MKKLLFLAAFMGVFSLGSVAAQSCATKSADKACCAGKPCAATKMAAAAKADATIEARLDPNGSTSYVRKENGENGTVRLVDVKFDESTSKFVNVAPGAANVNAAPAGMVKKEATCAPAKKACCAGGANKSCAKGEAKTEAVKE